MFAAVSTSFPVTNIFQSSRTGESKQVAVLYFSQLSTSPYEALDEAVQ